MRIIFTKDGNIFAELYGSEGACPKTGELIEFDSEYFRIGKVVWHTDYHPVTSTDGENKEVSICCELKPMS